MPVEELTSHGKDRLRRSRGGPREVISLIRRAGVLLPRESSGVSIRQDKDKDYFVVFNPDSWSYFIAVVSISSVVTILPQEAVYLDVPLTYRKEAYRRGTAYKYERITNDPST